MQVRRREKLKFEKLLGNAKERLDMCLLRCEVKGSEGFELTSSAATEKVCLTNQCIRCYKQG